MFKSKNIVLICIVMILSFEFLYSGKYSFKPKPDTEKSNIMQKDSKQDGGIGQMSFVELPDQLGELLRNDRNASGGSLFRASAFFRHRGSRFLGILFRGEFPGGGLDNRENAVERGVDATDAVRKRGMGGHEAKGAVHPGMGFSLHPLNRITR